MPPFYVFVQRADEGHDNAVLNTGDVITVRYETYTPAVTAQELQALVGKQSD